MLVDIVMPKMGESIQEGKILRWTKKVGDKIQKDETILEISTDKVDSEIPSPVSGVLTKIVVAEQEVIPVGAIIALIETDMNAKIDASSMFPPTSVTAASSIHQASAVVYPTASTPSTYSRGTGSKFLSPLVRSMAEKEGVSDSEFAQIAGTGSNGRITKSDLMNFLQKRGSAPRASIVQSSGPIVKRLNTDDLKKKYPAPAFRVAPMDNVQIKMAEHMLRSVATSPHVAAIDEIDVTRIVKHRTAHAAAFEQREGFKLTFTPFFADAVVRALKEYPIVNSSVEGDHVIYKTAINLGIAVASPTGLIVPNVRNAEEKNFIVLARAINDLAVRTRTKKLIPDDVSGGTFSITNYGVFGNIIGTPIINQPQVAILGIGAIKKRPMVVTDLHGNDAIVIRSMVYLTLSFDHRVVDGAIGGQFLTRVKQYLEEFDLNGIA
jgi:2-oxoglutarate dehydrogenase E2 component (dihydrolipoamide succinyltransferase)